MGLPKIVYDAGAGPVTVQCVRGPRNFVCGHRARVNDNVAASGLRERVIEGRDMLISFAMESLRVDEDLDDWAAFAKWALGGGTFEFHPNADASPAWYVHCVLEDDTFEPARVAPGRYSAAFSFRIVPDTYLPADISVVMKKFYGV